jgi:hypothetical protein
MENIEKEFNELFAHPNNHEIASSYEKEESGNECGS